MKRVFTLVAGLLVSGLIVHATVRTVSNDPENPAQYTNINDAIQASSPGDTILVSGSPDGFTGTTTIDREIVLIGPGYKNPYGYGCYLGTLSLNGGTGSFKASNSKISGFNINTLRFNGTNADNKTLEGILIERCRLHFVDIEDWDVTYRNDTIRNCLLRGSYVYFDNGQAFQNIVFHNNIFDNQYFYSSSTNRDLSQVVARNNVFINRTSPNTIFSRTRFLTLENNVFYGAEPQGCTDCTFSNNFSFQNSLDSLAYSTGNPGSIGSGNVYENPGFVEFPISGGAFSYEYDLNVTHADAVNGGTDGTDIGIHGGMLPYEPGANPSIPQMTEIDFTDNISSVKVGGTLNVTFKAKKQD